jgi:hypothetical protein
LFQSIGVYVSTNFGYSWERRSTRDYGTETVDCLIKTDDNRVLVGTSHGVLIGVPTSSSVYIEEVKIAHGYILFQNYPNPFNPVTQIQYLLPKTEFVTFKIYNSLGQHIRTLISEQKPAGYHNITWDGTNDIGSRVSSGLYIYKITAGDFTFVKKMLLVK